ncbi:10428_t:CDS:2 [Cetraspora pellucida]|uniref:10428_t:CDS:1 n=1 Tax=Cetraspora pellucida TaxID=1433469 RepID=A0A9N9EAS5_9GLOM|nr:10428_t:CDS:2 [Cetraspora pellucida]
MDIEGEGDLVPWNSISPKHCGIVHKEKTEKFFSHLFVLQNNEFNNNNFDIELVEINIDQLSQFIEEFVAAENQEFELNVLFDINGEMNSVSQVAKKLHEIIENSDGYKWNQSAILNDFKDSNRKQMLRFECNEQIIICVNMIDSKAYIKCKHLFNHEQPAISTGVPKEIITEIQQNCHLDPLQLHFYLSAYFDLKDITSKQIYYWWIISIQSKYQKHKNPIQSAILLLQEQFQNCQLLISINNNTLTAIAFSTPNFQYLKSVKEIHIDATYKTSKGHFELYGIIGEYQGTGFALGYLILDIQTNNGLELSKSEILT